MTHRTEMKVNTLRATRNKTGTVIAVTAVNGDNGYKGLFSFRQAQIDSVFVFESPTFNNVPFATLILEINAGASSTRFLHSMKIEEGKMGIDPTVRKAFELTQALLLGETA